MAVIVAAQWLGTSLWFSPSGASDGISAWLGISAAQLGWLIAATQGGFIIGTVISAGTGVADRLPPELIFIVSSVAGAVLNVLWTLGPPSYSLVWLSRFAVGLALAGVYPMGMKMVVRRAGASSARALSWLVAMLTLGTAMPHLLGALGADLEWEAVISGSSGLAVIGAILVAAISVRRRGRRRESRDSDPIASSAPITSANPADTAVSVPTGGTESAPTDGPLRRLFSNRGFRAAVLGYVGHMWELYAFWAVVPALVVDALVDFTAPSALSMTGFAVISAGVIGCVVGGQLSRRIGSTAVAASTLAGSGLMCLIYPLLPTSPVIQVAVLVLWGGHVIADSPQFSDLAAHFAPAELTGTGLTAMNSLGFAASIISILLAQGLIGGLGVATVWLLLAGPVLGLVAMLPLRDLSTPG